MNARLLLPVVVCLIVVASAAAMHTREASADATSVGQLVGHVVDAVGQPLSGVAVTTVPTSGGQARRVVTGPDRTYRLGLSPAGTYRVDYDLLGFDLIRRNHVRVDDDTTTKADATLPVSDICECIAIEETIPLADRPGQVVDEAGWPLPHARLEVVTSIRREKSYADFEGRFLVRLPLDEAWLLTASDTGFHPLTQSVSGSMDEPVVLSLVRADTIDAPEFERFRRGCDCGSLLSQHKR